MCFLLIWDDLGKLLDLRDGTLRALLNDHASLSTTKDEEYDHFYRTLGHTRCPGNTCGLELVSVLILRYLN